eukprot:11538395-Alexandrium_andersonii.AAC.1
MASVLNAAKGPENRRTNTRQPPNPPSGGGPPPKKKSEHSKGGSIQWSIGVWLRRWRSWCHRRALGLRRWRR